MTLHEQLRKLRTEARMTQAEVAEKLNVTRQTVSSYESGRTQPDVETLKRLAEIYGVPVQEILRLEESADKRSGGRILWLLRATEAIILVCTLTCSILLWVANRFYAVPSGQVLPEMRVVLETRFAITDAARWFESALLAGGRWLGVVLLVQAVRRSVPAKQQWKEFGILVGGMLLVTVPWSLTDPLFGFWNYGDVVVVVLCNAALFLMIGLFVGWLLQKRK